MERARTPEQFQPRMVASFNKTQLRSVDQWLEKNVTQTSSSLTQDFIRAVDTAEFDEKGKKMDEKARNRLKYAIKAIGVILTQEQDLSQIQGSVTVWQVVQDESKIEVRWDTIKPSRNSGQRRY